MTVSTVPIQNMTERQLYTSLQQIPRYAYALQYTSHDKNHIHFTETPWLLLTG